MEQSRPSSRVSRDSSWRFSFLSELRGLKKSLIASSKNPRLFLSFAQLFFPHLLDEQAPCFCSFVSKVIVGFWNRENRGELPNRVAFKFTQLHVHEPAKIHGPLTMVFFSPPLWAPVFSTSCISNMNSVSTYINLFLSRNEIFEFCAPSDTPRFSHIRLPRQSHER